MQLDTSLWKSILTLLTIVMPLWSPSKIFTSLRQILKLSSANSSTHTAIASWDLLGNWWLGVASTIGGVAKRFKEGKKKMNEFKDPAKKRKKRQRKVTTHSSGCTTTAAAAAKLKQQQKSLGFTNARFTISHSLSPRYRNKNFFWEETLTLKPWEKVKNILQTVPAIVKYDYFV